MQRITNDDFVLAWLKSQNYEEVAERLGVSKLQVISKSQYLRKLGVNLPKYKVGPQTTDVDGLNALIQSYAKKNAEAQ
jgi:hypothetical protein